MDKNDPAYMFAQSDAAYIYSKLGALKRHKQENREALVYLGQALALSIESRDSIRMAWVFYEFSKTYWETKQLDSSLYYAGQTLRIAQGVSDSLELTQEADDLISRIYEKLGDFKKALRYKQMALDAREKLYNDNKKKELNNITFRIKQSELEFAAAEKQYRSRFLLYSVLAGLFVILFIASILYYQNRQKQKANAILEKTLSNLQSTQTQLIQSEKLASLGELTAGIAHEIQNPLNFVNNFSELSVDLTKDLKDEISKPDVDKDYVDELLTDLTQNQEKINHHGKRAAAIVSGMLYHARASTGKKEPTDLNALADEYLRLAYHGLRAKNPNFNAKMVTDFDPTVGKVEVIPQDMGRVLLNLINNAFYAVQQRQRSAAQDLPGLQNLEGLYAPTVTVSTQKTDNQIVIKVKDNGTGIPEEVKAKIFQPFFTTKPTGQGTGLGLSLAYDIVVKGHGGTLEVESTEDVGSEFIIQLPC
ncbi:MAG: ATP-binding protein [Thermoanaerobaculia bacterium]|nr:ATP-binding protein [Thermoanaerobaculia bacterium]